MVIIGGIAFVVVVVVLLVLMLMFHRWTLTEAKTAARLRSPETHRIVYVVPDGSDPLAVMAALSAAGFASTVDYTGGVERLLVECEERDRPRVRTIIERAGGPGAGRSGAQAAPVSFEDEARGLPGPRPA